MKLNIKKKKRRPKRQPEINIQSAAVSESKTKRVSNKKRKTLKKQDYKNMMLMNRKEKKQAKIEARRNKKIDVQNKNTLKFLTPQNKLDKEIEILETQMKRIYKEYGFKWEDYRSATRKYSEEAKTRYKERLERELTPKELEKGDISRFEFVNKKHRVLVNNPYNLLSAIGRDDLAKEWEEFVKEVGIQEAIKALDKLRDPKGGFRINLWESDQTLSGLSKSQVSYFHKVIRLKERTEAKKNGNNNIKRRS